MGEIIQAYPHLGENTEEVINNMLVCVCVCVRGRVFMQMQNAQLRLNQVNAEIRQRTLAGFLQPIVDLTFRSMAINEEYSPIRDGHFWEAKLIALECANFIVNRVEEDILDQDAPPEAPVAQVAAPVEPLVVDLVSDEEEPAPPVIPSPEFNSGEEDDVAAPPTPSTEEEEDYVPPTHFYPKYYKLLSSN
jgi:hypothetical protein